MTFFQFIHVFYDPPVVRSIVAGALGLCVGSFLNVVALRSLAEQSIIFPASHCRSCKHSLSAVDMIPVLGYFLLKGKCRYCSAPIAWYYPFVEAFTALTFVALVNVFQNPVQLIGMTIFSCVLIATCVTDFKEKLIPHEITYPAMYLGIIYSALTTDGVTSSLIAVGVAYLFFDSLSHYGQIVYRWMHKPTKEEVAARANESPLEPDPQIDTVFDLQDDSEEEEEEIEVMGGADAVLAAVIGAWLGWQGMAVALFVGFMASSVVGAFYLFYELRKQKLLGQCLRPTLIGATIGLLLIEGFMLFMNYMVRQNYDRSLSYPGPELYFGYGSIGAISGGVIGSLFSGVKPGTSFPFGPGLAIGAAVAMFVVKRQFLFGGS